MKFVSPFVNVEAAPDRHHEREQHEREHDAQHGQQAPALIAKGALGYEASQCHASITPEGSTAEDKNRWEETANPKP